MVLSIFAALMGGCAAIAALSGPGRLFFHRRYRRGEVLRGAVAVLGAAIFLGNILCAAAVFPLMIHELCLGTTMAILLGTGVVLERHRIGHAPAAGPHTVLAIGAHPDDLEIACGGTLSKLVDAGHQVHVMVMSHGAVGGDQDTRPSEAHAGSAFMGIDDVQVHNFPDTRLAENSQEMIAAIEARIRETGADIVLTHSEHDHHQDHHAVHMATLRAARQHPTILCYESPSVTRRFNPAVFIDIADYVDVKITAVAQHRDQSGKPYMGADRVRGAAAFRGTQAKQKFAEAFEPVRMLGSSVGMI
jgi:LmbE family N-acetylglucosaminyl deacetylase